jgi:hypothetical protein
MVAGAARAGGLYAGCAANVAPDGNRYRYVSRHGNRCLANADTGSAIRSD